jgi:hypothetical protein
MHVKVTEFREPDLDNQLTAIAFLSDSNTKRVTSGLPLAFKNLSNNISSPEKKELNLLTT